MSLERLRTGPFPSIGSVSLFVLASACGVEAPVLVGAEGSENVSAEEVGAASQALAEPIEVINYPEYFGSSGSDPLCWENRSAGNGFQPREEGRYPLFLYFVGTGDNYASEAAREVTRAMATRGYVAVSVQYENNIDVAAASIARKVGCLFDPARASGLTGVLCSMVNVDCSKGIVTWGHSQGAAMAWGGGDYDGRVRGTWLTGYGEGIGSRAWAITHTLPKDRVRIMNGVLDGSSPPARLESNHIPTLNEVTGRSCLAGPGCLTGANGSGWYLVQDIPGFFDVENRPDHCWFVINGFQCAGIPNLEPTWIGTSAAPWGITANTNWLDSLRALGNPPPRTLTFDFTGFRDAFPAAPTALTDQYPWGVVDWTGGNFNVRLPITGVAQEHAVIGSSAVPATGTIRFVGPQGRRLQSVVVYNPGPGNVTVSAVATRLDGTAVAAPTADVAVGERTITYSFGADLRGVSFGVSKGSQLKWKRFAVFGAAPSSVPILPCPAPRLALKSRGTNLYVTTSAAFGNQLFANGSAVQATVFDCLNEAGGNLVLRAPTGHVGTFNHAAGNDQLYANKTLAAADRFTRLDLGKGFIALRAALTLQYVAAEALSGGALNANRPDPATWEHFQVEPR